MRWTKSSLSFLGFIECFLEIFVVCDFIINFFSLIMLICFFFEYAFVCVVKCLFYIPFIHCIFIIISRIIIPISNLIHKLVVGDILQQLCVSGWVLQLLGKQCALFEQICGATFNILFLS